MAKQPLDTKAAVSERQQARDHAVAELHKATSLPKDIVESVVDTIIAAVLAHLKTTDHAERVAELMKPGEVDHARD